MKNGRGARTHEDFSRTVEIHRSTNKSFGLVFATVFLVAGVWPLWYGRPVRGWALAISGAFLVTALIRPVLLQPLNAGWTWLGLLLARIVNPLVTGLLFFLVFTPMATLFRLMGRDLLRLRFDDEASSYWIQRRPPGPAPQSMSNQF